MLSGFQGGSLRPLCLGFLLACGGSGGDSSASSESGQPAEPTRLRVFVVSEPLRDFAERIGGDSVEVSFPAPVDADPALWSPDVETIGLYQRADLILLSGAGYATWVGRSTLPHSRMVDTAAAVDAQLLELEDTVTHSHGPGGEHSHAGNATELWLDPRLAIEQARGVTEELAARSPGNEVLFRERFSVVAAELETIGAGLDQLAPAATEQGIVFSHPTYSYLARCLGVADRAFSFEAEFSPSDEQWARLDHELRHSPARWMVWDREPTPETRDGLEERGVGVVVYNPFSRAGQSHDFVATMRENVARLSAALNG